MGVNTIHLTRYQLLWLDLSFSPRCALVPMCRIQVISHLVMLTTQPMQNTVLLLPRDTTPAMNMNLQSMIAQE